MKEEKENSSSGLSASNECREETNAYFYEEENKLQVDECDYTSDYIESSLACSTYDFCEEKLEIKSEDINGFLKMGIHIKEEESPFTSNLDANSSVSSSACKNIKSNLLRKVRKKKANLLNGKAVVEDNAVIGKANDFTDTAPPMPPNRVFSYDVTRVYPITEENSTEEVTQFNKNSQQPVIKNNIKNINHIHKTDTLTVGTIKNSSKSAKNKSAKKSSDIPWSLDGIIPVKCEVCNKVFSRSKGLQKHLRFHDPLKKRYDCQICGASVSSKNYLITHIEKHEKIWKCDVCGKEVTYKISLVTHMREHMDDKRFMCDFCGKRFVASSCLVRHRRTHTGISPYQCRECNKTFAQRVCYRLHLLKYHAGEAKYTCDFCGKGFIINCHLVNHMKKHMK